MLKQIRKKRGMEATAVGDRPAVFGGNSVLLAQKT
jgi:hypothetical protein